MIGKYRMNKKLRTMNELYVMSLALLSNLSDGILGMAKPQHEPIQVMKGLVEPDRSDIQQFL